MSIVIQCENLEKTYLSYKKEVGLRNSIKGFFNRTYIEKRAIQKLNLSIEEGIIIGLVGANGAGKTTLLKLLSGLIFPTSGSIKVLNHQPFERSSSFLKQVSILLGQKNQLWWDISPMDSFQLLASIYDLDEKSALFRVKMLSEMLGCQNQLPIQLRRLSLGERMKMELIGALLHKPKILFLDEPTIGLDIVAQNAIRHFLENYVKEEKPTIILTSHYMDDISKLAHRLLLMKQGEIRYDGTVTEFMNTDSQLQKIICTFQNPITQNIQLKSGFDLKIGQEYTEALLAPSQVSSYLNELMQAGTIQQIKVEETDFEEVIRRFLEKDASIR